MALEIALITGVGHPLGHFRLETCTVIIALVGVLT